MNTEREGGREGGRERERERGRGFISLTNETTIEYL